jgi:hypothetical protein
VRTARSKVQEFADALRACDDSRLRALATCVITTAGIRDARLRYLEPPRSIAPAALDSLSALYAEGHRIADSLYTAAPDSAADLESRFARARSLALRAATTRAALRAAAQSSSSATIPPAASAKAGSAPGLRAIRAHLMVRFAGDAVGPDPIDRDMIVRMLRAPGGPWVVFACDLASDAPGPLPF